MILFAQSTNISAYKSEMVLNIAYWLIIAFFMKLLWSAIHVAIASKPQLL